MNELHCVDYTEKYPVFTPEMKADYTLLVPDMLPWHFDLLTHVLREEGYRVEVLHNEGREVIDEGLRHVHNDTCFPALCVIGQFLNALKSGKYDVNKTAVVITQTGGGCRASNYLPLIRKALKAEFPQVPVLSLNFSGLEKGNGIALTVPVFIKLAYAIFYGDLVMTCFNQTKPYEVEKGASDKARAQCVEMLKGALSSGAFKKFKRCCSAVIHTFAAVKTQKTPKIKAGIVGEIYVKYSPLGNSHLEDFLLSQDVEPVMPALMDFILYCVVNNLNDAKYYGRRSAATPVYLFVYRWLYAKQKQLIKIMQKEGTFAPLHDFGHLRRCADLVIDQGVKMGEGWLIPAEMAALAQTGTENIICTQPFGCLPNHIVGKGAVRSVKQLCPNANVVAVDYDPSATRVNQENRIKLMLERAKENLKTE